MVVTSPVVAHGSSLQQLSENNSRTAAKTTYAMSSDIKSLNPVPKPAAAAYASATLAGSQSAVKHENAKRNRRRQ